MVILSLLGSICAGYVMTAGAQDLGSSNGLFGAEKRAGSTTVKTTLVKKAAPTAPKTVKRAKVLGVRINRPDTSTAATTVRIAPRNNERPVIAPRVAEPLDPAAIAKYSELLEDGRAFRLSADAAAAESSFRRATAIKPNDPAAFALLGELYTETLRWEQAEKVYRWALALNPADPRVAAGLSRVLLQPVVAENLSDRYDEAETIARKGIESRSAAAAPYDLLGMTLERRGLLGNETERLYRLAIMKDAWYAPAHAHLGRMLRRMGKTDAAKAAYQTAISKAVNPASMIEVADSLQSEQRYAESLPLVKKALVAEPRNYTALVMLGRAMMADGDLAGAESNLIVATRVSPFSFTGFGELGKLYLRQSKLEMAETVLQHGTRLADAFERKALAAQFETLGDAYVKNGKMRSAESAYRTSMSLDATRGTIAAKIAGIRR